jgi:hypothetical protein
MASRSEIIRERMFECIHNGELENSDLVKICEYIVNDILQAKTKSNYRKGKISKFTGKEPSYHLWKWAKGGFMNLNGTIFIVDND